jgi:hypothetical protein
VESYDGTMLLQDVHLAYWTARASTDKYAFYVEVDALICLCLVTNAMAGKLPKEGHVYRPLRIAQEWPSDKKAEKRPRGDVGSDGDIEPAPRGKKTTHSPRWTTEDESMEHEHDYFYFRELHRRYEEKRLKDMEWGRSPWNDMRSASGYSMYASGSRLSPEAQPETDHYLDLDLEDGPGLLMSLFPDYKEPNSLD